MFTGKKPKQILRHKKLPKPVSAEICLLPALFPTSWSVVKRACCDSSLSQYVVCLLCVCVCVCVSWMVGHMFQKGASFQALLLLKNCHFVGGLQIWEINYTTDSNLTSQYCFMNQKYSNISKWHLLLFDHLWLFWPIPSTLDRDGGAEGRASFTALLSKKTRWGDRATQSGSGS